MFLFRPLSVSNCKFYASSSTKIYTLYSLLLLLSTYQISFSSFSNNLTGFSFATLHIVWNDPSFNKIKIINYWITFYIAIENSALSSFYFYFSSVWKSSDIHIISRFFCKLVTADINFYPKGLIHVTVMRSLDCPMWPFFFAYTDRTKFTTFWFIAVLKK